MVFHDFNFRNFFLIHLMNSPQILIEIQWFLIPWICFQILFLKILISLISHNDSLFDLIEFQKIIWNYHNSPLNRPLFTTMLLNSWLFDKLVSLVFVLTLECMFSTTLQSRFVSSMNMWHKRMSRGTIKGSINSLNF